MTRTEIFVTIGFALFFGGPILYLLNKFLKADEQDVLNKLNQAIWANQMGFRFLGENLEGLNIHPNAHDLGVFRSADLDEVICGEFKYGNSYLGNYTSSRPMHVAILEFREPLHFNTQICDQHLNTAADDNGKKIYSYKIMPDLIEFPLPESYKQKISFRDKVFQERDHVALSKLLVNPDLIEIVNEEYFAALFIHDYHVFCYRFGPLPDYEDGFVVAVNFLKKLVGIFSGQATILTQDPIQTLKNAEKK